MESIWSGPRHYPDRLPLTWARGLAVLALFVLALAADSFFIYDGWQRVAAVVAFTTMGLGNLAWALGSLLPEGRLSRAARIAVSPLSVIMLLALGASLAFLIGCGA